MVFMIPPHPSVPPGMYPCPDCRMSPGWARMWFGPEATPENRARLVNLTPDDFLPANLPPWLKKYAVVSWSIPPALPDPMSVCATCSGLSFVPERRQFIDRRLVIERRQRP